jgi:hypothetical protein
MDAYFGNPTFFPVSLGFNCHVRVFINKLGQYDEKHYERQIFDWLGTRMWSICELLENNFSDLLLKDLLQPIRIFKKERTEYSYNMKYGVGIFHDLGKDPRKISNEVHAKAEETYIRRVERWNELLKKGTPIVFLRLEQDLTERNPVPSFERPLSEKEYLEAFADRMKAQEVNYRIVYLNYSEENHWDAERRICYLKYTEKRTGSPINATQIESCIDKNKDFIKASLAKN